MILLFPPLCDEGGELRILLFNRPASRKWLEQQKYAQSPSARSHNGGADFFDRVLRCQGGAAGIRSGLIILNKAKPLGLSVCRLSPNA